MEEKSSILTENIIDTLKKSLKKSFLNVDIIPEDKLKIIELNENIDFADALFILQDFLQENEILDYQIASILDDYSEKITKINSCKEYNHDVLLILLYSSVMLYNDLSNPEIKKKLKLQNFIKMMNGCNNNKNFPMNFLTNIYNKIYDKIKSYNIIDNILHQNNFDNDKLNHDKLNHDKLNNDKLNNDKSLTNKSCYIL